VFLEPLFIDASDLRIAVQLIIFHKGKTKPPIGGFHAQKEKSRSCWSDWSG